MESENTPTEDSGLITPNPNEQGEMPVLSENEQIFDSFENIVRNRSEDMTIEGLSSQLANVEDIRVRTLQLVEEIDLASRNNESEKVAMLSDQLASIAEEIEGIYSKGRSAQEESRLIADELLKKFPRNPYANDYIAGIRNKSIIMLVHRNGTHPILNVISWLRPGFGLSQYQKNDIEKAVLALSKQVYYYQRFLRFVDRSYQDRDILLQPSRQPNSQYYGETKFFRQVKLHGRIGYKENREELLKLQEPWQAEFNQLEEKGLFEWPFS